MATSEISVSLPNSSEKSEFHMSSSFTGSGSEVGTVLPKEPEKKLSVMSYFGLDGCLDILGLGAKPFTAEAQPAAIQAPKPAQAESKKTPQGKNSEKNSKTRKTSTASTASYTEMLSEWVSGATGVSLSGQPKLTMDQQLDVVKGGALFWWHSKPGQQPKAVWLSLIVAADMCSAEIEWRNPQLVLNRPVDREFLPLDSCTKAKAVGPEEARQYPNVSSLGADGMQNSLVIVANKMSVFFEAANQQERDVWAAALQCAIEKLNPVLYANARKKIQEERRLKEMEERKASRDTRRAEYAKAGMSNTARIMATRE